MPLDNARRSDVWLENFFYQLPIWACFAVAFVPAAVAAVVIRPFARTLVEDGGTTVLRDRVFALASTAFVFVVALSTNTLWTQDADIANAARSMVTSGQELAQTTERTELQNHDQIVESLNRFLNLVADQETEVGPLLGADDVNESLRDLREVIFSNNVSDQDYSSLDQSYQNLIEDRSDYLSSLNQPGVPDILWIAVIILGLLLIATFALYPIGRSRRFSNTATVVAVFTVGLIQLPMWVLNSSEQVAKMVDPFISLGVGESVTTSPPIVAQLVVTTAVAMVGAAVALGLFVLGRRRFSRKNFKRVETDYNSELDLLNQIRDSLHSIEAGQKLEKDGPSDSKPDQS